MIPPILPLAFGPEDWSKAMAEMGGKAFHGRQVFRWIHARSVTDPDQMSDLPAAVRAKLATSHLSNVPKITRVHESADRTRKLLVGMVDGAAIETVLIPGVTKGRSELPSPFEGDADAAVSDDEDDEEGFPDATDLAESVRVTQCISTQVGCAMGCGFCASGIAGLKRQLGADEIVSQVILGKAILEPFERLTNVVLMGMGEPLHNYAATERALRLLTHADGIGLSHRRITLSTSGLVPEIAQLGKDFGGNIGLAISLHAADDETRTKLMPINRKYPLAKLMDGLRAYPVPKRRRITIEYTLIAGQNDSLEDARKLCRLLRGLPVKINLIPMNPIEASGLGPPPISHVLSFQRVLVESGYSCFIRRRRGDDVSAACGQLVLLGAKPKVRGFRA